MATPLLETLREQTRGLHQALDHHPQMMPLLDAKITLAQYRDILSCMYPLQAGLEQHVAQLPRAYFAQAEGAMVWPQTLAFIQELDAVEHQHCVAMAKLAFAQYIAAFDNLNHK